MGKISKCYLEDVNMAIVLVLQMLMEIMNQFLYVKFNLNLVILLQNIGIDI